MVLASLRQSTEHLHRRVEAAVQARFRCHTVESYGELLGRFYGFHRPFERMIHPLPVLEGLSLELPSRRKARLLEADLGHLGYSSQEIESLPLCQSLPAPRTVAEALGCLYVIEGSTLGGQVIRRQMRQTLGLPDDKLAFFSSYGSNTGRMWQDFCKILESAITTAEEVRNAQELAAETFEAFGAWFAPPESRRSEARRELDG